jgi:DNA primase
MSQVDEVRAAADIVKVVGDYVKLRKAGANFMGLCPFHQEKTPSFAVHPIKQIFHCFGCGVGGDVFKFVMLIENVSFPEALRRVAEKVGVPLRENLEVSDAKARQRATLYKIHETAANFFASQLGATAEGRAARAYLADRGLSDEMVGRFRLGYAPADGQVLTRWLLNAGFTPEALEGSGLVLREGTRLYDRFRRRIIFPIANESGKVVAFGGRALGDDQPKYLNSPETPIYTKGRVLYNLDRAGSAIRKLDYAILVEGYMDCIAVVLAGIDNVVAACGTSLTEAQVRLLARYSRKVVVNYDPDSAGVAATERSLNLLLAEGLEPKVLVLPGGLDPDAFVRKEGAAAYQTRLRTAPSYVDFLTDRAISRHGTDTTEGKAAVANEIIPYIAKVPNNMLRGALAEKLIRGLGIHEGHLVREHVMRSLGEHYIHNIPSDRLQAKATPAEKQLLRAFIESEELADEFLAKLVEEGKCQGLATEEVFKGLLEARRRGEKIELSRMEEWLTPEARQLVYECLFESGELPDREQILACYRAVRRMSAERERDRIQVEIQAAERAQDQARLSFLLDAKAKLVKEIATLSRR